MANETKTYRFGPGSLEGIEVTVFAGRRRGVSGMRCARVSGSYVVYAPSGEYVVLIDEGFSGFDGERAHDEDVDLLLRAYDDDEEAARELAENAIGYALEGWTDPNPIDVFPSEEDYEDGSEDDGPAVSDGAKAFQQGYGEAPEPIDDERPISRADWDETPADYRHVFADGGLGLLEYDPKHGTVLARVRIVDEDSEDDGSDGDDPDDDGPGGSDAPSPWNPDDRVALTVLGREAVFFSSETSAPAGPPTHGVAVIPIWNAEDEPEGIVDVDAEVIALDPATFRRVGGVWCVPLVASDAYVPVSAFRTEDELERIGDDTIDLRDRGFYSEADAIEHRDAVVRSFANPLPWEAFVAV